MEPTTAASNIGAERPTKRIRMPTQSYVPAVDDNLSRKEEEMLAQAISNSQKDQGREPLTTIPFGPTFYPTVEEFSGDPLVYLETIRSEAEKYGKC